MKLSGRQCRLVKLQRPPPEIRIFLPQRSACSSTATRRPRLPASMAHMRPAAPPPRMITSKTLAAGADMGFHRKKLNHRGHREAQSKVSPLFNLHYFFLFPFAHLFHLLDLVIGELLDLVDGALLIVFGNFLVFHGLLDAVVAVAANVADSGAVVLKHFVQVLDHVFAPF